MNEFEEATVGGTACKLLEGAIISLFGPGQYVISVSGSKPVQSQMKVFGQALSDRRISLRYEAWFSTRSMGSDRVHPQYLLIKDGQKAIYLRVKPGEREGEWHLFELTEEQYTLYRCLNLEPPTE